MKHLPIYSREFTRLLFSYAGWLELSGYSSGILATAPAALQELFHYAESKGIHSLDGLSPKLVSQFEAHLQSRPNQRRDGGLSASYLQKMSSAIRLFQHYHRTTYGWTPAWEPAIPTKQENLVPSVLSVEEVKRLFQACSSDAVGYRDKAMLCLYYDCGLRKSEGLALTTDRIDFARKQLTVTTSKTGRGRVIPLTTATLSVLEAYLYDWRPLLGAERAEIAVLLSSRGRPLSGETAYWRFCKLLEATGIDKQGRSLGLHALRHSIATHLLQGGMKLEDISSLLGHKSLDSTQIYTHLKHET